MGQLEYQLPKYGCASCCTEKNEGKEQVYTLKIKKNVFILALSCVMFIAGLLLNLPFWIEFAIFGVSTLLAGGDIIYKAFKNVVRGYLFDENSLMTIAAIGAFAIKEFPEAAAVMIFFKVGELVQDMAVNRSRKSIEELIDIRPDYANVKTVNGLIRVSPSDVSIGNLIVIKPGEKVPLDGLVVEGNSFVDTSALTGEPVPRSVNPGDTILSGSINNNGLLTVKVTKTFGQSTVSKILDLVQSASAKKAPVENFITKFAKYYTPAVVAAAFLIAVLPPIITFNYQFGDWIYRALIFLVISCPCALVISIPLSFFGGIGAASRKGILIKGSSYLEALNNVGTVVFDKTGTLTKGVFKVCKIIALNGFSKEEVLEYAALAESHSGHPIAKSILEAYGKPVDNEKVTSYNEIIGQGISAVIDGKVVLAGNDRLLLSEGIIEHNTCSVQGTVVHVAVDNIYAGYILISDEIKQDSFKTIKSLKAKGISHIIMLSGDSRQTVEKVGRALGINKVYSELLPHQKIEQLKKIKNNLTGNTSGNINRGKNNLVFVGDGINDAPSLAMSDIGVAMGALGSDAAIEASDIVLMTDEPFKLVEAVKIARETRAVVFQNILLALGTKLFVLILGAGGIATMWGAVIADVGVALIAVLNAARLIRKT
jgi:Cd2+/Zn2+-exporting ATPase